MTQPDVVRRVWGHRHHSGGYNPHHVRIYCLIELNKITCLAVASNMTDFLQSVEATEVRNRQALEAYKQSIMVITEAHNNAMENMQRQH